ncbi:MAG TPA: PAS domain S-box protein, partial [Candidatus Binataceae bacterium]|nr:PAS domain S-box protein [Candidatus Binataceae bacterium]
MTKTNIAQTNDGLLKADKNQKAYGVESPIADDIVTGATTARHRPTLSSTVIARRYLRRLIFGICVWLGYQLVYLGCDISTVALSRVTVALHVFNFLVIVTSGWLLLFKSMAWRYWRLVLLGVSLSLIGSTIALSLINGTPLAVLTTLILLWMVPGETAPWRWHWNAGLWASGFLAVAVMEKIRPDPRWDDYWLILAIATACLVASEIRRDLRRTRRGVSRQRRTEKQLIATRSELRERIARLQASESRLLSEAAGREGAERRARANESFLRAVFEASPDPIGITRMPDGKLIDLNPAYAAMLGLTREEAIGKRIVDLNVQEQQFVDYVKRLTAEDAVTNLPMDLRDKGGKTRPYLISAVLADLNGEPCSVAIGRDISGVREGGELLRIIAEASPDPIALTSYPEARMIYCNRQYAALVGLKQDQIVGRRVAELNLWVSEEERREYARLLRTEEQVSNFEGALYSSDGSVHPCLLSASKVQIDGQLCVLTVSRDISEIKETQRQLMAAREELRAQVEALQASEARLYREAREREAAEQRQRKSEAIFRKVFDTSIDIIGINSIADGRFIALNRSLAEFAGLQLAEVLGRSALDLNMWVDHERAREYRRMLKRDGSVHAFEANLRRWDGTVVPHITSAVVVEIEGEPCVVAIAHDISVLKRAETELLAAREELSRQVDALRESERRVQQNETVLRKIFDASPYSTALIRLKDGKHLTVNEASTRIFGYSLEEYSRRCNGELNLWVNGAERREYLRRLLDEGRIRNMEVQLRKKDGQTFFAQLSAELTRIAGERCVVAMAADISGRKQIEAELVAAREEAVAASEAKSNFLSSMSHEIRTPMNAMLGMADLLSETPLTSEQRRYLDTIRSNSSALLELINGILDLAKVESGRLSLEWIAFDLRELVERVLETLGVKAHQKWLELAARIDPKVPAELVGDPTRLRQILMNLIGNAIKFTDRGEIVLAVETVVDPAPESSGMATKHGRTQSRQQRLRFEVRDTGIGIPHDRLDQVFTSFTQAESSTARKYGGSGLGLAIVKRLVELMGGTLTVTSEPGMGSAFSFTIAFQMASEKTNLQRAIAGPRLVAPNSEQPAVSNVMPDLSGRRMLVADDTAINRMIVREILEARGARVAEATSGEWALALVTEALENADPFEVMLLDGRMPGLDGIETARRLLRDDEMRFRAGAVILMVTSDALNPTLARCREIGLSQMAAFRYVV